MIELWAGCRGSDFVPDRLPFAGGLADQPACVMAAFAECAAALRKIRPRLKEAGE